MVVELKKDVENRKSKNIELFIQYVNKYMGFFQMSDWKYSIKEQLKDESRASTYWYDNEDKGCNQIVTFCYSLGWVTDVDTTEQDIKETAFHEVWELILSKLRDYGSYTDIKVSERELDNEIHRIIRKMENLVFPYLP